MMHFIGSLAAFVGAAYIGQYALQEEFMRKYFEDFHGHE